jgi:hypothetical protein
MLIVTKLALVMLAGIYAMRSTSIFFHPEPFEPLMIVAALAFLLSVFLFYRPPTAPGWWQFTVIGLCVAGVLANGFLYFAPDASHASPTQLAFSACSVAGWLIVALSAALLTMASPSGALN